MAQYDIIRQLCFRKAKYTENTQHVRTFHLGSLVHSYSGISEMCKRKTHMSPCQHEDASIDHV
jgi:hypothetical protein